MSGPSGVGKTTLVEALAASHPFHFSVSATTRDPRPGEVHGEDYFFVDDAEFLRRIEAGELLEWAVYNGRRYGTPRGPVELHLAAGHDVVLDIEVQGARQVREADPEAVLVFVAPPSLELLEARLRNRGDTSDADVRRRLEIARRELAAAEEVFDHVIVNDDVDRAVAELAGILQRPEETDFP